MTVVGGFFLAVLAVAATFIWNIVAENTVMDGMYNDNDDGDDDGDDAAAAADDND